MYSLTKEFFDKYREYEVGEKDTLPSRNYLELYHFSKDNYGCKIHSGEDLLQYDKNPDIEMSLIIDWYRILVI